MQKVVSFLEKTSHWHLSSSGVIMEVVGHLLHPPWCLQRVVRGLDFEQNLPQCHIVHTILFSTIVSKVLAQDLLVCSRHRLQADSLFHFVHLTHSLHTRILLLHCKWNSNLLPHHSSEIGCGFCLLRPGLPRVCHAGAPRKIEAVVSRVWHFCQSWFQQAKIMVETSTFHRNNPC